MTTLALSVQPSWAQVTGDAPGVRPDAIVDLKTDEGIGLLKGQWRYSNVKIVDVDHHSPGADLAPSGPPNRTQDIDLHAGTADFDDSKWEHIKPAQLEERRSTGRLCFNWYRTSITIPDKIGSFDPTGSTVVFEVAIDDYAEVWVDGKLPLVLGQPGGQLIKGFNAPNRVVLTKNARPGQRIQLAVFGINGPLSNPAGNFIWVRSATLDFYETNQIGPTMFVNTEIVRVDPALDAIVSSDTKLEKLAGGFLFTEGPVWVPATANTSGYLLFSDPNANIIYRWSADGQVSVFRTKSGYAGFNVGEYHQPGSNGLTLDSKGRLTINQHGNRRVIRVEPRGNITVLADRYDGKRLNSPNDLVYRSDGALYFTDPPYRLTQGLRRSAERTALQWRLLRERPAGEAREYGSRCPQRARLLAGRDVSVCEQLERQEKSYPALRRKPGLYAHKQLALLRYDQRAGERCVRWIESRSTGQCVFDRTGRALDHLAGGQAARPPQRTGRSPQHGLG